MVNSRGLEQYRRHIFLCADQTVPNCAAREEGLQSWDYLKRRLKELPFCTTLQPPPSALLLNAKILLAPG